MIEFPKFTCVLHCIPFFSPPFCCKNMYSLLSAYSLLTSGAYPFLAAGTWLAKASIQDWEFSTSPTYLTVAHHAICYFVQRPVSCNFASTENQNKPSRGRLMLCLRGKYHWAFRLKLVGLDESDFTLLWRKFAVFILVKDFPIKTKCTWTVILLAEETEEE